jgi:hypothetical protein
MNLDGRFDGRVKCVEEVNGLRVVNGEVSLVAFTRRLYSFTASVFMRTEWRRLLKSHRPRREDESANEGNSFSGLFSHVSSFLLHSCDQNYTPNPVNFKEQEHTINCVRTVSLCIVQFKGLVTCKSRVASFIATGAVIDNNLNT